MEKCRSVFFILVTTMTADGSSLNLSQSLNQTATSNWSGLDPSENFKFSNNPYKYCQILKGDSEMSKPNTCL